MILKRMIQFSQFFPKTLICLIPWSLDMHFREDIRLGFTKGDGTKTVFPTVTISQTKWRKCCQLFELWWGKGNFKQSTSFQF